jgi:hypothetical protein
MKATSVVGVKWYHPQVRSFFPPFELQCKFSKFIVTSGADSSARYLAAAAAAAASHGLFVSLRGAFRFAWGFASEIWRR